MSKALTVEQLNISMARLNQRSQEFRNEIHQALLDTNQERYLELAGNVHDASEEALANSLTEIGLTNLLRYRQELNDIDSAIVRIKENSYGFCKECNKAINAKRLEAYPSALRCLECQNEFERHRST